MGVDLRSFVYTIKYNSIYVEKRNNEDRKESKISSAVVGTSSS
jgi:hypothetical protein